MAKNPEVFQLPSFPDYLNFVIQPRYPKLPSSVYKLKDRGKDFGITKNDLSRVMDVARPLLLLPFSYYRDKYVSRTIQTFLSNDYIPSLAALIYFGYDHIFVQDDPDIPLETTLAAIHPRVKKAMPEIRSNIRNHSDILKRFPDIEMVISDPTFPDDPKLALVKVEQVRRRFNPKLII